MEWPDSTEVRRSQPGDAAGEVPLAVDLTFLALRDACSRPVPSLPSETPQFESILRDVLLQQGEEERERQLEHLGDAAAPGVFPVLTRLLAADEALANCGGASSSSIAAGGRVVDVSDTRPQQEQRQRQRGDSLPIAATGGAAIAGTSHGYDRVASRIISISSLADVRQKLLPADTPRRVCQYAFLKNDIVWICKNCQADETCVLCNDCFRSSDHEGHEVYFYHAQVPVRNNTEFLERKCRLTTGVCNANGPVGVELRRIAVFGSLPRCC